MSWDLTPKLLSLPLQFPLSPSFSSLVSQVFTPKPLSPQLQSPLPSPPSLHSSIWVCSPIRSPPLQSPLPPPSLSLYQGLTHSPISSALSSPTPSSVQYPQSSGCLPENCVPLIISLAHLPRGRHSEQRVADTDKGTSLCSPNACLVAPTPFPHLPSRPAGLTCQNRLAVPNNTALTQVSRKKQQENNDCNSLRPIQ